MDMLDTMNRLKRQNDKLRDENKKLREENKELRRLNRYFNQRVSALDEKEYQYNKLITDLEKAKIDYANAMEETKRVKKEMEKIIRSRR